MSYKAGIIKAISSLKDHRTGSSMIAIKKHMQADLPSDKKMDERHVPQGAQRRSQDRGLCPEQAVVQIECRLQEKVGGGEQAETQAQEGDAQEDGDCDEEDDGGEEDVDGKEDGGEEAGDDGCGWGEEEERRRCCQEDERAEEKGGTQEESHHRHHRREKDLICQENSHQKGLRHEEGGHQESIHSEKACCGKEEEDLY
mmetsp:Transcript_19782/g.41519  ORF Transcript_19782/g.41519 Transcript_19782/m.41519 type:complete len:199 (-) Transcript_19782:692-1288(-)